MRGQNLYYDVSRALYSTVIMTLDHTDNAGERVLFNGIGHTSVICVRIYVPSFLVRYQSLVQAKDCCDQISDRRLSYDHPSPIAESTAVAPYGKGPYVFFYYIHTRDRPLRNYTNYDTASR